MEDTKIRLWDFALHLYNAQGVADACLALQEKNSVDVPVLLFAAWLKRASIALSPATIEQIEMLVGNWRNEIIGPLRTLRRRLKTGPKPAPGPQTETFRDTIKAAELSAERIELDILETEGLALVLISDHSNYSTDDNLLSIVRHYHCSRLGAEALAAISVIEGAITGSH